MAELASQAGTPVHAIPRPKVLHAIPKDPVLQHRMQISQEASGLSYERRKHYADLLDRIDHELADGMLTQQQAVHALQQLGEQAHQESQR